MKKIHSIILIIVIIATLTGCQSITRDFGGTTTIHLEPNLKLEEITWKEDSLWYLTKPMAKEDVAEVHTFQQQSNFGVFEGTVTIIESKANESELNEYKEWNEAYMMSWDDYLWYKEQGYTLDDILNGNVNYNDMQEESDSN